MSSLELTFFGLTSNYRAYLFNQIHEILFHGQGGYSYDVIYNMPVWLRNFTYNKLKSHYDKINNQENTNNVEKSIKNMKSVGATRDKLPIKKISPPTYVTKASKK
jgi:hypothetical protein